jgi:hypothetical protein
MRISPPVRMNRSGSGAKTAPCAATARPRRSARAAGPSPRPAAGLHHVPAAAVVEGHRQRDAGVVGVSSRPRPRRRAACRTPRCGRRRCGCARRRRQLAQVLGDGHQHQAHQPGDFVVGRFQFSDEKANTVRYSTPRSAQALMTLHQRIHALLVAEEARHVALLGPAAVAVHHDGHMARHRHSPRGIANSCGDAGRTWGSPMAAQTAITSASLPCTSGRSRRSCGRSASAPRPARGARRPR